MAKENKKGTKPKGATTPLNAAELDAKFDAGDDVSEDFEPTMKPVLVEMPIAMAREIDAEAARIGVARVALIKMWIDEKLRERKAERSKPA